MRLRHGIIAMALSIVTSGAGLLATNVTAGAAPSKATVTIVHGIPNVPVTVYANNRVLIKRFVFDKTATVSLNPGTYALAIRPFGAAPKSKAILAATETVTAGENATVVANLTAMGTPTLTVFANPTTPVSMKDVRVIVRHVAAAPAVDVYANSKALFTNLANPMAAQATVPAGTYSISVYPAGAMTTSTPAIGPASFAFAGGKTYIIYAIGSLSGKTLTVAVQSY